MTGVLLRSTALTVTHCTLEWIKHSFRQNRGASPREGLLRAPERPLLRPAPTGRSREAPRELPHVCARNPGTRVHEARAIALETTARARANAGRGAGVS